jgi:SAM-dependent methyltransferase
MSSWFASPYYALLYAHRNDAEAENFVKVLLQKLNLHPPAKVLDVGCGRGRYARAFAKYGFEVDAIDYAVQPLDYQRGLDFTGQTIETGLLPTPMIWSEVFSPALVIRQLGSPSFGV